MLFGAGVATIAAADRLQRPLALLFGARALGFAGLMTYPMYLIHQRIGKVAIVEMTRLGVDGHAAMLVAAGLSLAIAAAVVLAVEPPLRRWLARRWDGAMARRRALAPDSLRIASPPAD